MIAPPGGLRSLPLNRLLPNILTVLALCAGLVTGAHADSTQYVFLAPVGATTTFSGSLGNTATAAGDFTDTFVGRGARNGPPAIPTAHSPAPPSTESIRGCGPRSQNPRPPGSPAVDRCGAFPVRLR